MKSKVLVTYATKYGATMGIAEKIGQVIGQSGFDVDIHPVKKVKDLANYNAVVLGSAVYIGMWRKEAAAFLKANEHALSGMPVWLFSSGPADEGDVSALVLGWKFPGGLQATADRIKPRDITIFKGFANASKMNPIEKWMLNNVKSPAGDFRDWEAISAWGKAIADALMENGSE